MQKQDTVASLKAKLIRAMEEALKDGTSNLKEQVEHQQEQLSEKDGLLKKETRKRRNRFRAYVDCLYTLTECQAKCERLEAGLHKEPPQPERSWCRQVEVEEENQALKEEVDLLKVGQRRLEDELMTKNQLIMSANEKKRAQTSAYIDCLALLTTKEQELKKSLAEVGEIKALKDGNSFLKEQEEQLQEQLSEKNGLLKKETRKRRNRFRAYVDCLYTLTECHAKCEKLEAGLHQEPPQPETSWGRQVEVEEENQRLKEEVNLPKVGQRRLEDELIQKNQLIVSANEKKRAQTSAYIDSLALLTAKEMELNKSQAETLEVKLQQTPLERLSFREEQVDKENQALKEQDNLPKVGQRRQEVKLQQTRSERLSCRMVEAETMWSREVEVDKENRFLKERLKLPKVRQRGSR